MQLITCRYLGTDNILKCYLYCSNLSNLLAINTSHIGISKPEETAIMRRRRRDIDGMKTTLIYSTNEIVKVSIPTLAITLLNVLLRSMTIDIIIPAIDKRKNPILKPSKASLY